MKPELTKIAFRRVVSAIRARFVANCRCAFTTLLPQAVRSWRRLGHGPLVLRFRDRAAFPPRADALPAYPAWLAGRAAAGPDRGNRRPPRLRSLDARLAHRG